MDEYLKPELLVDLFNSADVMTESEYGDNDFANPWIMDLPQI